METMEPIWKYAFAEQPSEQRRIVSEIGVGYMSFRDMSDILTIENTEQNIKKLEEFVENHRDTIDQFEQFMENEVYERRYNDEGNVEFVGIPFEKTDLIEQWKENHDDDIRFYQMVETYLDYMKEHEDRDFFNFEGEY